MSLKDSMKNVSGNLSTTKGKVEEKSAMNPFALTLWRWDQFLSEKGVDLYNRLGTLDEKTIFIYVFLSRVWPEDLCCPDDAIEEEMDIRFKFAFFLADAISNADLEYSTFPALIDKKKNPYLAYLVNTGDLHRKRNVYYAFMSILHGTADPLDADNWIYDIETMKNEELSDKMEEMGKDFYDGDLISYPDPQIYEIDEKLLPVQLKIKWFFGEE